MLHRHLHEGYEDSVEAVEDVLSRGTEEDWRELARQIIRDPKGAYTDSLRIVLANTYSYGTTRLWQDFLQMVETGRPPGPPPLPAQNALETPSSGTPTGP